MTKVRIKKKWASTAPDTGRPPLGLARGGRYKIQPENLNRIARRCLGIGHRANGEIWIHMAYDKEPWAVNVNRQQIEQVFLNVYRNALEAMPEGGTLSIKIENVVFERDFKKLYDLAPGRYVKVSVTDTGVGMDTQVQQRIFEPFFTTKAEAEGVVRGLGLAFVYDTVKDHGGAIDVWSERNKGTTVSMFFPVGENKG